jgi:hypothetical protein
LLRFRFYRKNVTPTRNGNLYKNWLHEVYLMH